MKKIFLFAGIFLSLNLSAQNKSGVSRILFVLDASGSMQGTWIENSRWDIARKVLGNVTDSLQKHATNLEMALRVYGHQIDFSLEDCSDTKLEVPFSANSGELIKERLKTLVSRGVTPIALSLQKAA